METIDRSDSGVVLLVDETIYKRIEEELRSQYSLGYSPTGTSNGSGYRKIHVTAKQKGLVVQARDGYYASF